jgi:hypothetical protein
LQATLAQKRNLLPQEELYLGKLISGNGFQTLRNATHA